RLLQPQRDVGGQHRALRKTAEHNSRDRETTVPRQLVHQSGQQTPAARKPFRYLVLQLAPHRGILRGGRKAVQIEPPPSPRFAVPQLRHRHRSFGKDEAHARSQRRVLTGELQREWNQIRPRRAESMTEHYGQIRLRLRVRLDDVTRQRAESGVDGIHRRKEQRPSAKGHTLSRPTSSSQAFPSYRLESRAVIASITGAISISSSIARQLNP